MELAAIYHRPRSEYAYLYKGSSAYQIGTKKEGYKENRFALWDPFIFIEDSYEDVKEMVKSDLDALFDYWQVAVSVRCSDPVSLSLRDKERSKHLVWR